MEILTRTLKSLSIAAPRTHGGLTMVPLVAPGRAAERGYLTLDEAVHSGAARISEIGVRGTVPALSLVNHGEHPVLLLDGEELIGAKQNRVLNLTILAPPQKTLVIPVSCVEAGRWRSVSAFFETSAQVMSPRARGAKSADVTFSMLRSGSRLSNQGRVWDEVAELSARHGVRSPTSRMAEVYEARSFDLDGYVEALKPAEGQVGAIFAIGGELQGLELFDDGDVLRRLLPKLVRSWALDTLPVAATASKAEPPAADAARAFLDAIAAAETTTHPAVGLGDDVRIAAPDLAGGALVWDGAVVHVCVFRTVESGRSGGPAGPGGPSREGRMQSASARRIRRRILFD